MTEQNPEGTETEGVVVVTPDEVAGVDTPAADADGGEPEPGDVGDADHGLPGDAEPLPDDDADSDPEPGDDEDDSGSDDGAS